MPIKTALIVDVDNTLLDWVRFWRASFGALVDSVLASAPGLERAHLLDAIRTIHRRVGTSEYAFVLQDLRPLLHQYGVGPAEEERAIRAYRDARETSLELYPGVLDTLQAIKADGNRVVAFTESTWYHTANRLATLGLDGVIDAIYSPPDYSIPESVDLAVVRRRPPSEYRLKLTRHEVVTGGFKKPDPALLKWILEHERVHASDAVYVGDSLLRDVGMAQNAGVLDVYAEYGRAGTADAAAFLLAVTHWSDEELAAARTNTIVPTITLHESFSELTSYVQFEKGVSCR